MLPVHRHVLRARDHVRVRRDEPVVRLRTRCPPARARTPEPRLGTPRRSPAGSRPRRRPPSREVRAHRARASGPRTPRASCRPRAGGSRPRRRAASGNSPSIALAIADVRAWRAGQSGTSAIAGSNSQSATNTPSIPASAPPARSALLTEPCGSSLAAAVAPTNMPSACPASPPITRMLAAASSNRPSGAASWPSSR